MDMATEEIRKQILDYVRRYGKKPSENDIDFSEKSSYSVHTLFKSLIFDGYIVENHFDTWKYVTVEEANEAMRLSGFRPYSVVK